MDAVQRVKGALIEAGHSGDITELPEPAPTAQAAADQLGCPVGAIANSLVFSVNNAPLLILTSGDHRVDTRKVAALLGVGRGKIRRADPEFVHAVTGQHAGGVAPIGHPAPIRTLVDTHLGTYNPIWAGAGLHHALFRTTLPELLQLTCGETAEVGET
ncbi:YbaK/EbsC family protein [Streptomyces sp. APSN-46.1]|uniref:YbaK/EbsC family protein n=1 Tax=Streptomyces sp. APSN-46.1 TaxID=2929049 RepID=UPI001FB28299|nr:YbaK/EbsC family protein [Streptomyces sp. APSN-46.1]MCJ1680540.1 YbaK/EbsC family protein [Streptomyces sp. APSN-46.1]